MSRTYFISYTFQSAEGHGNGMTEITSMRGINNFADLEEISTVLAKRNNYKGVVILNWKEIDAPEGEAHKNPLSELPVPGIQGEGADAFNPQDHEQTK